MSELNAASACFRTFLSLSAATPICNFSYRPVPEPGRSMNFNRREYLNVHHRTTLYGECRIRVGLSRMKTAAPSVGFAVKSCHSQVLEQLGLRSPDHWASLVVREITTLLPPNTDHRGLLPLSAHEITAAAHLIHFQLHRPQHSRRPAHSETAAAGSASALSAPAPARHW